MGVICYTKANDNLLMWSHYADGHKGICLEFELNELETLNDAGIYEVEYKEEYPEVDFSNIWHRQGLAKILWTKSKEWEYERELRQIQISGNELVDYPLKLSSIIFGLRTTHEDKLLIKNILKEKQLIFKNADLANKEFKILIKEEVH